MEDKKTFKSESVAFTAEFKPDCVVEYKVDVFPDITQKAKKEAIRSIAKEVSIPGFRKGRAPEALIVKKFAQSLQEKWHAKIANCAFAECQKVSKIPILHQDSKVSVNVDELSEEGTAKLTYAFETKPIIPSIDFANITLKKEARDLINEEKIEETIQSIRLYFAKWSKISNRAVQKDDYVLIDVDVVEETPPRRALTNNRFKVDRNYMPKWMFEIVLGMKIGETKQGVSIPDDDAPEQVKKDSPPKKVALILRSIEIAELPAVDDTLAKKVGAATEKEMRKNIERLLNDQSNNKRQQAYRTQIDLYLLAKYNFSLPKTVLQEEIRSRIKQIMSDPERRKIMTSASAEKQKAMIQEIEKQGEKALRLFYLTEKIIRDQNIRISPTEIDKESHDLLHTLLNGSSSPKRPSREQREIAMSRLMLTKAEDFLISKATIQSENSKTEETQPEKSIACKKTGGSKKNQEKADRKK